MLPQASAYFGSHPAGKQLPEKELGVLVDTKLTMSQQRSPVAKNPNKWQ